MRVAHAPRAVQVMATGFNELEILSQEDLIIENLRKLLATFNELSRREEATKEFFYNLCELHLDTRVWYHLWEAGGAQRFTDIRRSVGCSGNGLSAVIKTLLKQGLIRMVDGAYPYPRYQAISPAWLVRITLPTREKS